ncbi:Mss4-like protein [Mycena galopus ATCC 62051]|nr:Mss4-like protein [Mycena galopus ATCC 62051]
MSSVQRLGSCLCRKICFTVKGDPFDYSICHCINCKKFGGSAFMTNAFFVPDKIVVTKGEEFLRKYDDNATTSGNTLTRQFCSNCGTSLFLSSPNNVDWITLCPAAVDNQEWIPRRHNCPDAKTPWVTELHLEHKSKM